jgi:hypothetical protein
MTRLEVVDMNLPKPVGYQADPPEREYPKMGDYSKCEQGSAREQALPSEASSSTYEVVLAGERGFYDRRHCFLSDETYSSLTVGWDALENHGPTIVIAFHVAIKYRDLLDNLHTAESIWDYWPSREAGTPGYFSLSDSKND